MSATTMGIGKVSYFNSIYAFMKETFVQNKRPLWAAILEKAIELQKCVFSGEEHKEARLVCQGLFCRVMFGAIV